jgi:hypothetical protein
MPGKRRIPSISTLPKDLAEPADRLGPAVNGTRPLCSGPQPPKQPDARGNGGAGLAIMALPQGWFSYNDRVNSSVAAGRYVLGVTIGLTLGLSDNIE